MVARSIPKGFDRRTEHATNGYRFGPSGDRVYGGSHGGHGSSEKTAERSNGKLPGESGDGESSCVQRSRQTGWPGRIAKTGPLRQTMARAAHAQAIQNPTVEGDRASILRHIVG